MKDIWKDNFMSDSDNKTFDLTLIANSKSVYSDIDKAGDIVQSASDEFREIWDLQIDYLAEELGFIDNRKDKDTVEAGHRFAGRLISAFMIDQYNRNAFTHPSSEDAPPCLWTKEAFSDLSSYIPSQTDKVDFDALNKSLEEERTARIDTLAQVTENARDAYRNDNQHFEQALEALSEYDAQSMDSWDHN